MGSPKSANYRSMSRVDRCGIGDERYTTAHKVEFQRLHLCGWIARNVAVCRFDWRHSYCGTRCSGHATSFSSLYLMTISSSVGAAGCSSDSRIVPIGVTQLVSAMRKSAEARRLRSALSTWQCQVLAWLPF